MNTLINTQITNRHLRLSDDYTDYKADYKEIETLYGNLLDQWNERNPRAMADLFADDGKAIGYDGSQMNGPQQIEDEVSEIFAHHKTASFIAIIKDISFLSPTVALLSAVAGMIPPNRSDINPELNTIQTLMVTKQDGQWRISLFQNTPALFHGRPELREQLTAHLRQVLSVTM